MNIINKKGSRSQSEFIFLAIKAVIGILAIGVIALSVRGMETGCSTHDENPSACISNTECRPAVRREKSTFSIPVDIMRSVDIVYHTEITGDIECRDSIRTPNNRYHAAEDAQCVCPVGWEVILDREDQYYGVCRLPGTNNYHPCEYPPDGERQETEFKDMCEDGDRYHGEVWIDGTDEEAPNMCCDDGDTKECDSDNIDEKCGDLVCIEIEVEVEDGEEEEITFWIDEESVPDIEYII